MIVKIEKIRIYIKDNFDFTHGTSLFGLENLLGHWNFITNDVKAQLISPPWYYSLENEDYRNYRNEIGKGYDHHRYSTVEDIDKNYEFEMPIPI